MAEISASSRDYEKAINFYKEALAYDDTHKSVCKLKKRVPSTQAVHGGRILI
jgi:hypothetical protein